MAVSQEDWFHEGDMALLATSEFDAVEVNDGEGGNETDVMPEKPDITELALVS